MDELMNECVGYFLAVVGQMCLRGTLVAGEGSACVQRGAMISMPRARAVLCDGGIDMFKGEWEATLIGPQPNTTGLPHAHTHNGILVK